MRNPLSFDDDRVLLEQLNLVLGNFRSTFPVLAIPILLYWALSNTQNSVALAWWALAVILSHVNLQIFTRRQSLLNSDVHRVRKIVWIFTFFNLIEGVLWGLLSWLTLDTVTPSGFILVFAVFAGMLGGGLATQSPIPLLFFAFAIPQTLELALKLWSFDEPTYVVLSLGILIYLTTMFGQAINSAKVVRASIQLRFDIADSHAKLRKIEHQQTLDNERQRLMQDMHDGLGSSLISALRVVERGNMNDAELAVVLKGCIDDLKLAIDSMEPVDNSLLLLLATLRFRLGPRLESAGIKLQWKIENIPTLDWLDPRSALHILRILQEAIANIIKHTSATEVDISTSIEDDYVLVTVEDNGGGFDVVKALDSMGKGLSGQRDRAAAIDADITWQSNEAGTSVCLKLPIRK